MEMAKGVVEKYGSAANYTVTPASVGAGGSNYSSLSGSTSRADENTTLIGKGSSLTPSDGKNIVSEFSEMANVVVDIDVYSGESLSPNKEVIRDVTLKVMRQYPEKGSTGISIGARLN
jgi:hypothetical protein